MRTRTILAVAPALSCASSLFITASAQAQSGCQLVGVWELVSATFDGQAVPASFHQLKFITKSRWAWVHRDDAAKKDPKTTADSLEVARATEGGSGTYTVQGNTYTERIEFFPNPEYIGKSVTFSCRTEGDRFYQSGNYPILQGGKKVREIKLEEVYRRVE